jgi:hypothetical protein
MQGFMYISRMDAKLTLLLHKATIDKAKKYAESNHTSLDRLIENYLEGLVGRSKDEQELEISPFVRGLSSKVNLPEKDDAKQEYREHLKKKYS